MFSHTSATTIRRKAKLRPPKEIERQIIENESDPTASASHHTGYEPLPALKKKLKNLRAINLPPTPSLDVVVSLVRAEVDKRPSYFHVRLIPSRTECMAVHPPAAVGSQYIDGMEASRPGSGPGPYNSQSLSLESSGRYRVHLPGAMEESSNRPGAGMGSGSGSGPASGLKQGTRVGLGTALWTGVLEDIGGGKRSHDSPTADEDSSRHPHGRSNPRRVTEDRSETAHRNLDERLQHLQGRQHQQQQQQQQQHHQQQQQQQQQSPALPTKQHKKSFLKSSALPNKKDMTEIECDGPNNYPTKGPGLPPSYEFNPSMNLWTSSQYTSLHRAGEPPGPQSASSGSLRGQSWVGNDDACLPRSVSRYEVTSSGQNRESDGAAREDSHGRLNWPGSYPPTAPLEQVKCNKKNKSNKATKILNSSNIEISVKSDTGTRSGAVSGSASGGKKNKKLLHLKAQHAVVDEVSLRSFSGPDGLFSDSNSASVRVSEENSLYTRTDVPKFSPYRGMRERRDKSTYYAEGEGEGEGVGLSGVMSIDEALTDQRGRGRERGMEGESVESAHDNSGGSEDRSTGTMREESQLQPDASGYNYDNFFDDLMEVATSSDIEGYFDPKTV
jgi:hypothetical protein